MASSLTPQHRLQCSSILIGLAQIYRSCYVLVLCLSFGGLASLHLIVSPCKWIEKLCLNSSFSATQHCAWSPQLQGRPSSPWQKRSSHVEYLKMRYSRAAVFISFLRSGHSSAKLRLLTQFSQHLFNEAFFVCGVNRSVSDDPCLSGRLTCPPGRTASKECAMRSGCHNSAVA